MAFGIAFEGCAGRAAFHVGVVEGLLEINLQPDFVSGASAGAIVAACLASGKAQDLRKRWLAVGGSRVFCPEMMLRGQWPWRMSDILGQMLTQTFGDMALPEMRYPIAIPVTVFRRGRRCRIVLTRADDVPVVEAVLASCFVPGPYARPIRIGGRMAWDGAWMVRTPVDATFALGAQRVLAVLGHADGRLRSGYPLAKTLDPPDNTLLLHPASTLALGRYDTDAGRMQAAINAGHESLLQFARTHPHWFPQAS
ncbi:MAG: patatin-like phospholipase family protein [Gammaproteobacteria bacterium]